MKRVINSKTVLKEVDGIIYAFNEDGAYIYYLNEPISGTYIFARNLIFKGKNYELVGVGKQAFHKCIELDKLFLPNTINYIHEEAFCNCKASIEYHNENITKNIG